MLKIGGEKGKVGYTLKESYSAASPRHFLDITRVSSEEVITSMQLKGRKRYGPYVDTIYFDNLSASKYRSPGRRRLIIVTNRKVHGSNFDLYYRWGWLEEARFKVSSPKISGVVRLVPSALEQKVRIELGEWYEEIIEFGKEEGSSAEVEKFPYTFTYQETRLDVNEKKGVFYVTVFGREAEKERKISFPKSLGRGIEDLFEFENKEWINAPKLLRIKYEEYRLRG